MYAHISDDICAILSDFVSANFRNFMQNAVSGTLPSTIGNLTKLIFLYGALSLRLGFVSNVNNQVTFISIKSVAHCLRPLKIWSQFKLCMKRQLEICDTYPNSVMSLQICSAEQSHRPLETSKGLKFCKIG